MGLVGPRPERPEFVATLRQLKTELQQIQIADQYHLCGVTKLDPTKGNFVWQGSTTQPIFTGAHRGHPFVGGPDVPLHLV